MPNQTTVINLGGVNCYLVKTALGFLLIDTGYSSKRNQLLSEMEKAGCRTGDLKLIILTHGDFDHAGNARYLKEKHGAPIGMHSDDMGMVEQGDMGWNRKIKPDRMSLVMKGMTLLVKAIARRTFDSFKPDIAIDESFDLQKYGFDAKILLLPGHSRGSIGILTNGGDLFCGDFLYNFPGFKFIDDLTAHDASMKKLQILRPRCVYPGHGKPFTEKRFLGS